MIWNSKLTKKINTDIKLPFSHPPPFPWSFLQVLDYESVFICYCPVADATNPVAWNTAYRLSPSFRGPDAWAEGRLFHSRPRKAEVEVAARTAVSSRAEGSPKPVQFLRVAGLRSALSCGLLSRGALSSRALPQVLAAWVPPYAVHNIAVFFPPGRWESMILTNLIHTQGQELIRGTYPRRIKHWEWS